MTPQLRHGATVQHCGRDFDRKDADRNIGGPRYLLSGKPWELMQEFGLCAEHIAERVLQLRERWLSREEHAKAV